MESRAQDQVNHIINESIGSDSLKSNIKTYLLNPISAGLAGFAAFFTLILLTKLFSYLLGTSETFTLGISDVIYSLTGFVFVSGAKLLEFFHKEE